MEPPRLPMMGANLCSSCYPGAATSSMMCDTCFRALHAELNGETVVYSTDAIVSTIFQRVVPKRQHFDEDGKPTSIDHLLPELRSIDPLKTGAVLTGPSGRGKSFQAACLMLRGISFAAASGNPPMGLEFQWLTVLGLVEQLKGEFGRKDASLSVADQLIAARMLVLDDIGTTRLIDDRKSDWAYGRLLDIIDRRHAALRPTIATSNLGLGQLEQAVGARIVGRLVEGSAVVHVDGVQRRAPLGVAS